MPIITRTEETNITINLSQKHKYTLEKAAAMRCLSLSEYLLQLALNVATEELPEADSLVLSEKDWDIFTSALENPPLANEALKSAIKEDEEQYGKW